MSCPCACVCHFLSACQTKLFVFVTFVPALHIYHVYQVVHVCLGCSAHHVYPVCCCLLYSLNKLQNSLKDRLKVLQAHLDWLGKLAIEEPAEDAS